MKNMKSPNSGLMDNTVEDLCVQLINVTKDNYT